VYGPSESQVLWLDRTACGIIAFSRLLSQHILSHCRQVDCAYASSLDDDTLETNPVNTFKGSLDKQQLRAIQDGCPQCFSNLQVHVAKASYEEVHALKPAFNRTQADGRCDNCALIAAFRIHQSHFVCDGLPNVGMGVSVLSFRAKSSREFGILLMPFPRAAQAMWCAQTVPKCGSFESVVEGAILPALKQARNLWQSMCPSSCASTWNALLVRTRRLPTCQRGHWRDDTEQCRLCNGMQSSSKEMYVCQ